MLQHYIFIIPAVTDLIKIIYYNNFTSMAWIDDIIYLAVGKTPAEACQKLFTAVLDCVNWSEIYGAKFVSDKFQLLILPIVIYFPSKA